MVNNLIKINKDYEIDFKLIDKVLTNMVGYTKEDLFGSLK